MSTNESHKEDFLNTILSTLIKKNKKEPSEIHT